MPGAAVWSAAGTPSQIVTAHRSDPTRDASPPASAELQSLSEEALIRSVLGGCREAFDVIVERHQRPVYRVCYRFVGNHADASDLAQDVFLRAYRALPRFKGHASLSTWLHRIAVNVSLNHLSSRKPPADPLDPERHVDGRSADPAGELARDEQARRVRTAIARLPPKQRSTLVLRVYGELPHKEIARILGGSVGAVKANFFHALANLRKALGGEPPSGGREA